MKKLFYLELILNTNCNQRCAYCDLPNKGVQTETEVDLDYVSWILDSIPTDNLYIEITGGEAGLISNLPQVATTVKSHKNVQMARIMSNGLVRINHPDAIGIVDRYNEHLVDYLAGTNIVKFYPIEFAYQQKIKYVIVLSERTVRSILENFDYWSEYGLFNVDNFWLKQYVPRNGTFTPNHRADLLTLYDRFNTGRSNYCKEQLTVNDDHAREVCKKVSFLPGVDVTEKKLLHCSYHNFTNRIEYECSVENLSKLVNKTLFVNEPGKYCDTCYLYNRNSEFLELNNKANYRE